MPPVQEQQETAEERFLRMSGAPQDAAPAPSETAEERFKRMSGAEATPAFKDADRTKPNPADQRMLVQLAANKAKATDTFDASTASNLPQRFERAVTQAPLTAAQMVGESLLQQPPGQMKAAWRAAAGEDNLLTRSAKTLRNMFPKAWAIGGEPTHDELALAAKVDKNFGEVWKLLKDAQADSLKGDSPDKDWSEIERASFGRMLDVVRKRNQDGDSSFQPGNAMQMAELFDHTSEPGVSRRPLENGEVAGAAWNILRGVEAGDIESLPGWTKAIARGIASGVHLAATGAAAGLAGDALKLSQSSESALQFGALSAETQALAVSSGAQPEFNLTQAIVDAETGAAAAAIGSTLADKYLVSNLKRLSGMDQDLRVAGDLERVQRTASVLGGAGTLGAMEATNQVIDAFRGHQELHGDQGDVSSHSALNRFLDVGTTLVVAAAMGGRLPGRPRSPADIETAAIESFTRPMEPALELSRAMDARDAGVEPSKTSILAEQRAADKVTGEALHANIYEKLAQGLSLNGRIPAVEQIIKNGFDRSGVEAIVQKQKNRLVPLTVEVDRAGRNLYDFLDRKTGKDPKARAELMHVLWSELEGSGAGGRQITSMFRSKFSGETVNAGTRLLSDWAQKGVEIGKAGVEVNWIPEAVYQNAEGVKTVIYKRDFDEGRFSREGSLRGDYGKLVGGVSRFVAEGGYLPHLRAFTDSLSKTPWKWRFGEKTPNQGGGSIAPVSIEGPMADEFVRQRLMAREKTTPEFIQAAVDQGKVVDTSYESIAESYQREIGSIFRASVVEDARASGWVRRGNALPAREEVTAIRQQLAEIDGEIGKRREQVDAIRRKSSETKKSGRALLGTDVSGATPISQTDLMHEISALKRERAGLETSVSQNGWRRLEGKDWGKYDSLTDKDGIGWYMREDFYRKTAPPKGDPGSLVELATTLHRMAKAMRTGFSAGKRLLQDQFGNMLTYMNKGDWDTKENFTAKRDMLRYRMGDKRVEDPLLEEFIAVSKGHFIGSAGEMQKIDSQAYQRASKLLNDAVGEGKIGRAIPLALNKLAAFVNELYGKTPVIGTTAKFYKAVVDESDAFMSFKVNRKRGLSVQESWEEVAPIADYSSQPDGVQKAATALSFVRYPAQMARAYATKIAPRPATLYGINIGKILGLDRAIRTAPGSGSAQGALLTRSFVNLIAKASEVIIPVTLARKALLASQGTSQQQWDSYVDNQYKGYLPGVRELAKLLALPTGKTALGRLSHLDLATVIPWMAPLIFWKGSPEGGQISQLIEKNVLVSPWFQAAANRDFRMSTPEQGAMPGERWWGAVSQFVPGLITSTMNEVVMNKDIPASERSSLRTAAKMLGVPLRAGEGVNPLRKIIEQYRAAGLIQRVEGEDGSEMYGVVNRYHPLAPAMDALIQLYYAAPMTGYQALRRQDSRRKRMEEGMRLR